ncbi:hypothetical protein SMICM304S_05682 [Streptomyces microflavus]
MRARPPPVGIRMAIGVALNARDADNEIDATVELAREASAAGLRSAWFGQRFGADSPALAGIVGREVPGLQVGTSAIPIFGRHPLLVSSQAQTAQAATHGRYHLGLALGARHLVEGGFGIPFERPIARLREFLTALRELTETGAADFHGELLPPPPIRARPGRRGGMPLLVAARGPGGAPCQRGAGGRDPADWPGRVPWPNASSRPSPRAAEAAGRPRRESSSLVTAR